MTIQSTISTEFEYMIKERKFYVVASANNITANDIEGLEFTFYDGDDMSESEIEYDKKLFEELEDITHMMLLSEGMDKNIH